MGGSGTKRVVGDPQRRHSDMGVCGRDTACLDFIIPRGSTEYVILLTMWKLRDILTM